MVFMNSSSIIGLAITNYSNDVTGSIVMTLIIIAIIMMVIMMGLFRMPIELTAIVILPYILVCMAQTSEFMIFGGVLLIYMAILFVKNFWIQ